MNGMARHLAPGLFLAGLAVMIYKILGGFIEPMVWAAILVYASWPLYAKVRQGLGGRNGWSALAMVAMLGGALVLPLTWLGLILQAETADFFRQLPVWLEQKPEVPPWIERIPFLGEELRFVFDQFSDLQGLARRYAVPWGARVSGKLMSFLEGAGFVAAQWFFTLFLMFFFYRDGVLLASEARLGLARGLGERGGAYLSTAETTVKAVIYGIVLTALAQAVIAGLGYWLVGLQAPALLGLFTLLAAMIPFGTPVVWVGASLWLILHGERWAGVALLLWGALVVSWVDNVIRPLVISRTTRIPFALVVLGILGGLAGFGFTGLFVGPVILSIGLAVWREWLHPPGESEAPNHGE